METLNDIKIRNFDRFESTERAKEAFESEKTIMHHAWCAIEWLYTAWSPDRLTYLKNLEKCHMGTASMDKEIKRLEKSLEKEVRDDQ